MATKRGRRWALTAGTAVMRLAELPPFDFDDLTETVRRYVEEVEKLAREKRDQIIERNRQIDDGVYAAIEDPRHKGRTARLYETLARATAELGRAVR